MVRVLDGLGAITVPGPHAAQDRFWNGRHPVFGVWHLPNASATHKTPCFEVRYHTNSLGARDRERIPDAPTPRVVVLGDSYLEGWGVRVEDRLTDRLEAATHIEHINLAMSHFGPYQELLAYRNLGPRFTHSAVLIGILPRNDFYDLDYDVARHSPGYMYRYRPYLVGAYPDYHQVDYSESDFGRLLRLHCYACNALPRLYDALTGGGEGFDNPPDFQNASGIVHSAYYDYTPRQFDLLRYCLERLVEEAGGRTVVVVLLPGPPDFLRFHQSGPGPLARALQDLSASRRFVLVDLLPPMYAQSTDWSTYYLSCDPHWNEQGNAVAAGILLKSLRGVIY